MTIETNETQTSAQENLIAQSENTQALTAAEIAARHKLDLICEACDETKSQNFLALDVRRITPIADYFAICSGTSVTHIKSIADNVQDKLREDAKVRAKPQGGAESFWIILDYGDVILHVFDETTREFYDLERLWSDAPVVECAPQGASTPANATASETVDSDRTDSAN